MSMKHPHNWLHEKKLEQVLIAQRIVLQKNVIMPKGHREKLKVQYIMYLWNVIRQLPHPPERSGFIMLKLKRKL